MTKAVFTLISAKVRDHVIAAIRCAPIGYRVTIAEPSRSPEQNDAFHPIIRDIARTVPLCGKIRGEAEARRIFMSAFRTAQGEQVEVAEGLEGEVISLGLSTRKLTKAEGSDFIEYLHHFAATHGVRFDAEMAA